MTSLNVSEPIFRNYYIFGTQTDQQNQLKIFLCEVFFSTALNSVLSTNKGQPKDKFVFSFLLESRGEEGQDTPRYTHLKCKKGYFSKGGIFIWRGGGNAYEVLSHKQLEKRPHEAAINFALNFWTWTLSL